MQSLRRKTMRVPPVTVVRSALVCNPIANVVTPETTSFSDVLVKVISAPQSIDWAHVYQEELEATSETSAKARPKKESISPVTSWSPSSNNTTDLYVQLDTLLRHKSLLIGIA